jgi:hypothetical protein
MCVLSFLWIVTISQWRGEVSQGSLFYSWTKSLVSVSCALEVAMSLLEICWNSRLSLEVCCKTPVIKAGYKSVMSAAFQEGPLQHAPGEGASEFFISDV